MEEAPVAIRTPLYEKELLNTLLKQTTIKIFNIKSTKNNDIEIKYYILDEKIVFEPIITSLIPKKLYKNIYTYNDIQQNKFFAMCENLNEVFEEIQNQIEEKKDDLKLIEDINKLILIIPLNTKKIKEIKFEFNEINDINYQINDLGSHINSLINEIKDLKEKNKSLEEKNNNLEEKSKKLEEKNEIIEKKNNENKLVKNEITSLKNEINELKIKYDNLLKNDNNQIK